jgi:nucleotide-binding universal stress UspA family protein
MSVRVGTLRVRLWGSRRSDPEMHRIAFDDRRTGPVEGLRTSASILCPVDFSDESLATLARAVEIATRSAARLMAVHVADPLLVQAAAAAYHTAIVIQQSERALRDAIDHVRWETGAGGLEIATRVLVGDAATAICDFCRHHEVDLIVVGSHESGRYRHRLFGSVCEILLRSAPAPVLVFPTRANRLTTTVSVIDRVHDPASVCADGPAESSRLKYREE